MGCASSKQHKVCQNCRGPFSPASRSYSMHVHHPPEWRGDSYHVVSLTESTLGSMELDSLMDQAETAVDDDGDEKNLNGFKDFSMVVMEAKAWSEMLEKKIPKSLPRTPIRTPPGEPESIDAWELMEGLEDISPLRPTHHYRSFSFNVGADTKLPHPESSKPLWLEMGESESYSNSDSNSNSTSLNSVISEIDPEMISTLRKTLEDLPSANPFHLNSLNDTFEDVEKNCRKDRIVLYFTSLRGVRKTYEDCCHVRSLLKGLGIRVDERDVSMHSTFKDELKELSVNEGLKGMTLPRVFMGNKYIGDAEDIRRMHEEGELEKAVGSCELMEEGGCETCGDVRFVPCERCSGSCKIYYENDDDDGDYEEDQDEDDDEDNGFQRCPDCNENGLIRCPICCY
ncbi:uncharacterized protein At3g28850-like [Impatiens glandulifera]|uniref:uncharacterized protein At3g28850-like n=1 Tax=Impatiens glandulifera TaxID=253017 RepID=UPI001FB10B01|nr:uncharacterized protein At3g28850-like [Impatiens glandulifera]